MNFAQRQVPLPLAAAAPQRLDNFVPDANPQWPQLHELLHAPQPGLPVLLWGASGSGKTHLLQAAGCAAAERGQRVSGFCAHTPTPWTLDDEAGLLVLDDCDRYDAAQQHEAFRLFVEAASRAVPVLAASRVPPVDLPVREDLRTRLGWGWVYQLFPPSEDQVRALLRREADRRGVLLSEDVVDYLLTRQARDLASLMNLLERLDRFSLANQRAVTLPLMRRFLAEPADEPVALDGGRS